MWGVVRPLAHHVRRSLTTTANSSSTIAPFSSSSSSSSPQVLLERLYNENLPGVAVSVLTLNRPKANAMGTEFLQKFQECLDELEHESSSPSSPRCVVVTSCSNKVFSAGADLKERRQMTMDEAEAFVTRLRNTFEAFANLSLPTIAAIEGVALGGGLELALAADIRIASSSAVLGLPETSLAIVPGAGGTQRLPRLIGLARAKELVFSAQRIYGITAKEYGLVQHVVDPGHARDKALDLAWRIASNGPVAIRAAKFAMNHGMAKTTLSDALEVEREAYGRVLTTQDRLEGLKAFQDGRKPEYKGQ